jgi:predicted N-acetyltransferase YhbS
MRIEVRRAEPELMDAVRALVDDIFVLSRGLSCSLATRYPDILSDERATNMFVACKGRRVVATAATRQVAWQLVGREGRVAAVGLVATDPAYRSRGIASAVLKTVAEALAVEGISAAVLWTAHPAFYRRLGWRAADPGVLGTSASGGSSQHDAPAAEDLDATVVPSLSAVRDRHASSPFERTADTWRVVPAPADIVCLYRSEGAYALLGRTADERGYLYELVGEPGGFSALWAAIHRDVSTVAVNDAPGTPSYRWLSREGGVDWEPKPLAMWLELDDRGSLVAGSYVAYLDRI